MGYCICEQCGSVASKKGDEIICPNGCEQKDDKKIIPSGFGAEAESGRREKKRPSPGWGQK